MNPTTPNQQPFSIQFLSLSCLPPPPPRKIQSNKANSTSGLHWSTLQKELPKRRYYLLLASDWRHTPAAAILPSASQPVNLAFVLHLYTGYDKIGTVLRPFLRTFFEHLELGWALTDSNGCARSSLVLEIQWAESHADYAQSSLQFGHCSKRKELFQPPDTKPSDKDN